MHKPIPVRNPKNDKEFKKMIQELQDWETKHGTLENKKIKFV